MLSLKTHIWTTLVTGIILFLALAFSYFPLIETMSSSGELSFEPNVVHILVVLLGGYLIYNLSVITLILRANPEKLSLDEQQA